MYSKEDLQAQLTALGINGTGTLLMHSSFKSMGDVAGGPDTVLDALSHYMKDGLLVLPTHTWANVSHEQPYFDAETTACCVGILPELFRKRNHVHRSLHPTHSVAALGEDAEKFIVDDELSNTPCGRESVWGRLLDRGAQIILVGVDLRRNTFMHGVEEWADIPGRLTEQPVQFFTKMPDGTQKELRVYRHSGLAWHEHFWKVEPVLERLGAIRKGKFGAADTIVCDTVKLTKVLNDMLLLEPDLFSDNEPLSEQLMNGTFG